MNRRDFINMISAGAVLASFSNSALALPGRTEVKKSPEQLSELPNILWICTDQQRYDTIAALGNEYINTPHMF
jgi:hypothetical protein